MTFRGTCRADLRGGRNIASEEKRSTVANTLNIAPWARILEGEVGLYQRPSLKGVWRNVGTVPHPRRRHSSPWKNLNPRFQYSFKSIQERGSILLAGIQQVTAVNANVSSRLDGVASQITILFTKAYAPSDYAWPGFATLHLTMRGLGLLSSQILR
jgi:hypothetical protein